MPPGLHSALKKESNRLGQSINSLIVAKLQVPSQPEKPVVTAIKQTMGDRLLGIVLFGSKARGEERDNSDIDLLIVLRPEVSISRSLYTEWDKMIRPEIGEKYSPQFVHIASAEQCSSLWLEAALDGVIWADTDSRILMSIGSIRGAIASGRFRRKMSYGQPYWVREENP